MGYSFKQKRCSKVVKNMLIKSNFRLCVCTDERKQKQKLAQRIKAKNK